MYRTVLILIAAAVALTSVSGCSWRDVGDFALNTATHKHASVLVRDVERTAGEISEEEQAERVEELSADYEEFLRENSGDPDDEDDEKRSIIVVDPEERY